MFFKRHAIFGHFTRVEEEDRASQSLRIVQDNNWYSEWPVLPKTNGLFVAA